MTQQQPEQQPTNVIGSLANKEAAGNPGLNMGHWMTIVGVVTGIVGAIIMGVASSKLKEAKNVEGFTIAMGGLPGSPAIDAAVTWGHSGLGVLIFGALLAVAGLVVVALRRSGANDA
jgi:hypothetical protein